MVTSTVPGTVAVPVETLVSPVAAPVADVSPVAAFNPWEDDEDGSLPGSVVTSYGIKMKSAETAGPLMRDGYDLTTALESGDLEDIEKALQMMQGSSGLQLPTLRTKREMDELGNMVYQGFVLSSNGEQKKIGKELEAIIVFRTEKDDLREKMAKEDKFLGASSEYFPGMSKIIFNYFPDGPQAGKVSMQFNTPRDMKDAFKKLKDQHKVSENVKRSWYIVLYVLFREKGATDWTLAKMYLKYTQSAGAKYVGTEIEALLNNPLPGTLKAIDRKFNSSVHLTRTFKLDYGIYKLGENFVSYPIFEPIECSSRPDTATIVSNVKQIGADLLSRLQSALPAASLPVL